ncbi:MAG: hypothetical protein NWF04_10110 [Candidatus Bathyarchaeota archaeon]|nr:hypothetical protein [Candidatus Bathyarchaeota archaeon]
MTKKGKKQQQDSSMSFSVSSWFEKISTAKPPNVVITAAVLGLALFLFGGGLYDIILQPPPAVYSGTRFYFLNPLGLGYQFVFDTVVAVILYGAGLIGMLAMYRSAKQTSTPRQAYMTFTIGVSLLFIAYILLEYVMQIKIAGV